MNAYTTSALSSATAEPRRFSAATSSTVGKPAASAGTRHDVGPGQALHLGRLGGQLTVLSGSIWLTCQGDAGDHRLYAGQRMLLAIDDQAVIESWDPAVTASVGWKPRHQSLMAAVLAEPLRVLAFLAGRLAAGCSALARRASASARWAEGRIDAAGDHSSSATASRC